MNMNNRLRTTLYEMDIRIHTVDVSNEADEVTYMYHDNYLKQILPTIFFYQKYIIHLDENSFILCSLMTVFNINVNIFCLTEPN